MRVIEVAIQVFVRIVGVLFAIGGFLAFVGEFEPQPEVVAGAALLGCGLAMVAWSHIDDA